MHKPASPNRVFHLCSVIAIAALCAVIYSNSIEVPFYFDDSPNIKNNQAIRLTSLGFDGLRTAATEAPNPRPLANLSFALNYYFHRFDVAGYHYVNLAIHLLNGLLVYVLALLTLRAAGGIRTAAGAVGSPAQLRPLAIALFAALLFVAHPIQTQSVTYIVQRMNSMATLFYLLSLTLYLSGRFSPRFRWGAWAGAGVSWLLALASKEIAVTLPLIVFLYEWFFFRDLDRAWLLRSAKYLLGLVLLVGAIGMIYVGSASLDDLLAGYGRRDFTLWERLLTQPRVIVFYLGLLIYPHPDRLSLLHDFSTSHGLLDPVTTVLCILLLAASLMLAAVVARRHRLVSFCILWFFVHMALESSFFPLEMVFEHRIYLPMFGLALLLSHAMFSTLASRRSVAYAIATCTVLVLSVGTYARNAVWSDPVLFWSQALAGNPQSYRLQTNLGTALLTAGRAEESIARYEESIRIKPDNNMARINVAAALTELGRGEEAIAHLKEVLGPIPEHDDANVGMALALESLGRTDDAIPHYRAAISSSPNFEAHINLGAILEKRGEIDEAADHYYKALQIAPHSAEANNNLGFLLASIGKLDEAAAYYHEALRNDPAFAPAHNNLATALEASGAIDLALEQYAEALRHRPDYTVVHVNLGTMMMRQGRLEEAVQHFNAAVAIDPKDAEAHVHLGAALSSLGDLDGAIGHYQRALEIDTENADAHNNLANTLARTNRIDEAIEHYKEALRIDPEYVDAHNGLGAALAAQGKHADAIAEYTEALRLSPEDTEIHSNLGMALERSGDLDAAIAEYITGLESDPNHLGVRNNLANALARSGRFDEAIEHYLTTVRIEPDFVSARTNLAMILLHLERYQEAAEHFAEVLRLKPDDILVKSYLERARQLLSAENS